MGTKPKQVLTLNPESELHFSGSAFGEVVTTSLTLINPSDRRVTFKVKNTEPKGYCVRPNTGLIEPFATETVEITLKPVFSVNHHKFLVQSMFAPEDQIVSPKEFWKCAKPDQIMESTLNCAFDLSNPGVDSNQYSDKSVEGLCRCNWFCIPWTEFINKLKD